MAKKAKGYKIDWKSYIILFLLLVSLGMFALVVQYQTKPLSGKAYEASVVQCPDGYRPDVVDPRTCRGYRSSQFPWFPRNRAINAADCDWQCVKMPVVPTRPPAGGSTARPVITGQPVSGQPVRPVPTTRPTTFTPSPRTGRNPPICPDIAVNCEPTCTVRYDAGGCPVGCNCVR